VVIASILVAVLVAVLGLLATLRGVARTRQLRAEREELLVEKPEKRGLIPDPDTSPFFAEEDAESERETASPPGVG
jgi:hypothetical protein